METEEEIKRRAQVQAERQKKIQAKKISTMLEEFVVQAAASEALAKGR